MTGSTYDPIERSREKQASRDRDERDLAEGRMSREQMQARNGFIPGDVARGIEINHWPVIR